MADCTSRRRLLWPAELRERDFLEVVRSELDSVSDGAEGDGCLESISWDMSAAKDYGYQRRLGGR